MLNSGNTPESVTKDELHRIFQLNISGEDRPLLIFTAISSQRLTYICNFVFNHVVGIPYNITHQLDEFKAYTGAKLVYGDLPSDEAFHIPAAHYFIEEKELKADFLPPIAKQNGITVLFPFPENPFGFDLFSSVFYFISLYQEWQNFEADEHGRFELKASLQYRLNEHLHPLVNIWIDRLKQELKGKFPGLAMPEKKFRHISTIDVDNLYAYKNKGFSRTLLATAKDLLRLDFRNIVNRLNVVSGKIPDPFDVYSHLIKLSEDTSTPLFFFFLQRSGTKYDRTIDPSTGAFDEVFQLLKKRNIPFGLHPSYDASRDPSLLEDEAKMIRDLTSANVMISRQHFLRWHVKTTPAQLEKNGFIADFSLGFASGAGYRAMTFTPFYYFDFNTNREGNILMVPFAVMDGAYFVYSSQSAEKAEDEIMKMASEVKSLNGLFITVFHERTFFKQLYPGYGELYNRIQRQLSS
jgi:hypothetical protein